MPLPRVPGEPFARMSLTKTAIVALATASVLAGSTVVEAQPKKVQRVAFLEATTAGTGVTGSSVRAWLRELGYVEGDNVAYEMRFPAGRDERLPALAVELVRSKVDVIVAAGTPAIRAAKQATRTIPIVMVAEGDPVKAGLVTSLSRPGGNITGVTVLIPELSGKRLELLKEAVSGLKRVGVLWNPADPVKAEEMKETEAAARALNLELHSLEVRRREDLEPAFNAAVKAGSGAILVLMDSVVIAQGKLVADLALKSRLPAIYPGSFFVQPAQGGLISYGPHSVDLSRRVAAYIDRVLKGAKPSDLPVEQPTRFELVVNLRTAKALGLAMPSSILVRADELIE